jgi:hypothetical protein
MIEQPVVIEGLDAGIAAVVAFLNQHGVETYESCQGGAGHAFFEPTVRFHGEKQEGYRVAALLLQHGYRVADLRRFWSVIDGELTGPRWEVTLVTC